MAYIYCIASENLGENLKIHAGGDDKLRIQFAPPYVSLLLSLIILLLCVLYVPVAVVCLNNSATICGPLLLLIPGGYIW